MFKRFVRSAAVGALVVSSAIAQGTSVSPSSASTSDDCLKAAFDLAQKADDKRLSNEDQDRIEELLTKMEGHCDAKQFGEAQAMAKEIETVINTKQ